MKGRYDPLFGWTASPCVKLGWRLLSWAVAVVAASHLQLWISFFRFDYFSSVFLVFCGSLCPLGKMQKACLHRGWNSVKVPYSKVLLLGPIHVLELRTAPDFRRIHPCHKWTLKNLGMSLEFYEGNFVPVMTCNMFSALKNIGTSWSKAKSHFVHSWICKPYAPSEILSR